MFKHHSVKVLRQELAIDAFTDRIAVFAGCWTGSKLCNINLSLVKIFIILDVLLLSRVMQWVD